MTTERGDPSARPERPAARLARALEVMRFHPRETVALAVLGAVLVAGAGLAYVRARPVAAARLAPVASPSAVPSPEPAIWVHVVGAVRKPGVYSFRPGARVVDAVRTAGGFAPGADGQAINLARPLVDGEQVVVPRKGESPPPTAAGPAPPGAAAPGGKININLAGVSELDSLPGIGPVLAQRIVDYRTQHGPFRTVRDLLKVPGIGEKKFSSLEPYVTV
jgi:competence protein ComEA